MLELARSSWNEFRYRWRSVRSRLQIRVEKARGFDFSEDVEPADLGLDGHRIYRASPSGDKYLHRVLRDMKITSADSILDVGCAKGSAMKGMLKYPFRRIDGLEISETLSEIAKANFRRMKIGNVDIFNIDARFFEQYGDYNFIYFYNPFPKMVMAEVIRKLLGEDESRRHEMILIYNNPTGHSVVVENGFAKIREYPNAWGTMINVYSNRPLANRLVVPEDQSRRR